MSVLHCADSSKRATLGDENHRHVRPFWTDARSVTLPPEAGIIERPAASETVTRSRTMCATAVPFAEVSRTTTPLTVPIRGNHFLNRRIAKILRERPLHVIVPLGHLYDDLGHLDDNRNALPPFVMRSISRRDGGEQNGLEPPKPSGGKEPFVGIRAHKSDRSIVVTGREESSLCGKRWVWLWKDLKGSPVEVAALGAVGPPSYGGTDWTDQFAWSK
jgi:hypothetical protein